MFRSISTSRNPFRRTASALALAAAFAGASVAGSVALTAPVAAQDYSKGFVAVYQPVAEVVNAEGGDIASIKAQFPAIASAAKTADDKFAAGNLILIAGNKTTDPALQRQGLQMMVDSGKASPEEMGQFNYFIGSLAFQAKDYAAARTALEAAEAAGYTGQDVDIPGLIAESYFAEGNGTAGIEYVKTKAAELEAAGQKVPERWLLKALQSAYDQSMPEAATEISGLLVTNYPTARSWTNALQVVNALHEFDPQQQLDLFRLMRETDALTDRTEYIRYIEAADPRIMSNEVKDVLADGLAAGKFEASDTYYTEVKGIADQRAPQDQAEAPKLAAEAEGASDPRLAAEAGDVAYSLKDFTKAESLYQMALDKGATDRDTVLTRLGIAQARQGKFAEAQAAFDQVAGARAPIARMWSAYAQVQGGGAAQAQAPEPASTPAPDPASTPASAEDEPDTSAQAK